MRIFTYFLSIGMIAAALTLAGCANTIRGVGEDAANVVDATQEAGREVVSSVGG